MSDTGLDEDLYLQWLESGLDEADPWRDLGPGPAVDELAARVSAVPHWFLDDQVDVFALAGDVFDTEEGPIPAAAHRIAATGSAAARQGAAMGLWLFAAQELVGPLSVPLRTDRAGWALTALALRVAAAVPPPRWSAEADRREEMARTVLLWCGQLPAGEDERQAKAALDMCDSAARSAWLDRARREHRHRAEVARRLADARAREAATRYANE